MKIEISPIDVQVARRMGGRSCDSLIRRYERKIILNKIRKYYIHIYEYLRTQNYTANIYIKYMHAYVNTRLHAYIPVNILTAI